MAKFEMTQFNTIPVEQLASAVFTCTCGEEHTVATKEILFRAGALGELSAVIARLYGKDIRVLIATDETVWNAVGQTLFSALQTAGFRMTRHIYATPLEAKTVNANMMLSSLAEDTKLLIALGGGTVTDLVKYVAARVKLDYMTVPTTPTTDGYLTPFAQLLHGGLPTVFAVKPPIASVWDTEILFRVPKDQLASGYQVVMSKELTVFDWFFSHAVAQVKYCHKTAEATAAVTSAALDAGAAMLNGERCGYAVLGEALLKLSVLSQLSGSCYGLRAGVSAVAMSLKTLSATARPDGDFYHLAVKLLYALYAAEIKTQETSEAPDHLLRSELLVNEFALDETAAAHAVSAQIEKTDLYRYRFDEYREDFAQFLKKLEPRMERNLKNGRRLYTDAGHGVNGLMSEIDVRLAVAVGCDYTGGYSYLRYLKDRGRLERFLLKIPHMS